MEWIINSISPLESLKYKTKLFKTNMLYDILSSRNISPDDALLLLDNPKKLIRDTDFYGLNDVVNYLGLNTDKKYYVFADYDVDGMTSGYVITSFLKFIGYDVTIYYPERNEGYGLNLKFAYDLVKKKNLAFEDIAVITVDNGITANKPIQFLKDNGIDTLVIDHHQPTDELPNAIICDPWIDKGYGTFLAGVAVTWKVCLRIANLIEDEKVNKFLYDLTPFVALGTISDVMPMELENRAIVQYGLFKIKNKNSKYFNELKKALGLLNITSKDLAWSVAPKLNSCSRLGNNNLSANSLFLEDKGSLVKAFNEILSMDKERKSITDKAIDEVIICNDFNDHRICLYDASKYPVGIGGIIAAKLVETFKKPAIVYSVNEETDICHGSCRSLEGLDIKSILQIEVENGNIIHALGHSEACGVQFVKEKLEDVQKSLDILLESIDYNDLTKSIFIDSVINENDFIIDNINNLNSIPFCGKDFPLLGMMNCKVKDIYPFSNKNHLVLKMVTKDNKKLYAIGWNKKPLYEELGSPKILDIAGTLDYAKFSAKPLNIEYKDPVFMIEYIKTSGGN